MVQSLSKEGHPWSSGVPGKISFHAPKSVSGNRVGERYRWILEQQCAMVAWLFFKIKYFVDTLQMEFWTTSEVLVGVFMARSMVDVALHPCAQNGAPYGQLGAMHSAWSTFTEGWPWFPQTCIISQKCDKFWVAVFNMCAFFVFVFATRAHHDATQVVLASEKCLCFCQKSDWFNQRFQAIPHLQFTCGLFILLCLIAKWTNYQTLFSPVAV